MADLWLRYKDPDGVSRRVMVGRNEFTIGRQPDCDLAISDSRLSRKHACIVKTGGRFTIEDKGSSNGTDLNGEPVFEPVEIRNGDVLNFGGVEAIAEFIDEPVVTAPPVSVSAAPAKSPPAKQKAESTKGNHIPMWLILLIPALAAVLVVFAAGIAYVVISRGSSNVSVNSDNDNPFADADPVGPGKKKKDKDAGDDVTFTPKPADTQAADDTSNGSTDTPANAPPANLSETAKVEENGAAFLRRIAQNNPKAFLTTEQAKRVNSKVKQFSGSSAVADNINSARKNANEIKSLAIKKNLKPQLLAVAAIAKLGSSRGDVLATAQSMADVLDKLSVSIGNELADECLLTIAAYDQGAAGETLKMRDMLQKLANETSESSRTIRSIWFLQKTGKITQAEFDRALTFLAVGIIAQNPKEFGVNAEALDL